MKKAIFFLTTIIFVTSLLVSCEKEKKSKPTQGLSPVSQADYIQYTQPKQLTYAEILDSISLGTCMGSFSDVVLPTLDDAKTAKDVTRLKRFFTLAKADIIAGKGPWISSHLMKNAPEISTVTQGTVMFNFELFQQETKHLQKFCGVSLRNPFSAKGKVARRKMRQDPTLEQRVQVLEKKVGN